MTNDAEMRKHGRHCLMVMEKLIFACGRKHVLCSLQMKALEKIWHEQSGHPLQKLFPFLSKNPYVEVRLVKTCKLPYLVDKAQSDFPPHKIHCDLWCMAPITSVQIF